MLWVDNRLAQGMADFKMQMRSSGTAGIAAVADNLTLTHGQFTGLQGQIQFKLEVLVMPGLDPFGQWTGVALQVGINRGVTVGVVQIQGESVAGGRCFDTTHMARSRRQDRDTGASPGPVIQS